MTTFYIYQYPSPRNSAIHSEQVFQPIFTGDKINLSKAYPTDDLRHHQLDNFDFQVTHKAQEL